MGLRVLTSHTIPSKEVPDVWVDNSSGSTQIFTSRADCVHSDNNDFMATAARFTRTTSIPNRLICSSASLLAPSPIDTIAITAATPNMTPSIVSMERIL